MADGTKKVLLVAPEFEPFTSVGHLGRLTANLAIALDKKGICITNNEPETLESTTATADEPDIDLRVAIPFYGSIPPEYTEHAVLVAEYEAVLGRRKSNCSIYQTEYRGVKVYLLSVADYFCGTKVYTNVSLDIERFACFCGAVLQLPEHIGFMPDIVQCHDWQTSYIPILCSTYIAPFFDNLKFKIVFVIHSMRYQGICSRYEMLDLLDLPGEYFSPSALEFYGQANSLKGGLLFSDQLITVSKTYAAEAQHSYYGENLEGLIRTRVKDLSGIMCGIDTDLYDPALDSMLWANYDSETFAENKRQNKLMLQREFNLPQNPDIPVICIISKDLDHYKGMDLVKFVFDDILKLDVQLIVTCKNESDFTEFFRLKAVEFPDKVAYSNYNGNISATQLFSGCDILLRPSRVEPCGEKHLIAMRYGAIPIVRETGGLKDIVIPYSEETGEGNGFSFTNFNAHDMLYTLNKAVTLFREQRPQWNQLVKQTMQVSCTWKDTAAEYLKIYKKMLD